MKCNWGKKQFSFTLYNIIMDQINPTLVLITFSFIWLIKRLTQCCILEVKEQMVKIFPPKNMDCSLQVRSSQKIISWRFSTFFVFFFSDCCCVFFFFMVHSVQLKNRYNEEDLHLGSSYKTQLNKLPWMQPFICYIQIGFYAFLF